MDVRISSHGVVYDLRHSPFTSERYGILYRFSSLRHKEKFDANVVKKEEWLCDSLTRRFHVNVDARYLADLQLYYQVETRGYSICIIEELNNYPEQEVRGEEISCPQELDLSCLLNV